MRGLLKLAPLIALLTLGGVVAFWLFASPGEGVEDRWRELRSPSERRAARQAEARRNDVGGEVDAAAEAEAAASQRPVGRIRFEGRLLRGAPPQPPRPLRNVPLLVLELAGEEPDEGSGERRGAGLAASGDAGEDLGGGAAEGQDAGLEVGGDSGDSDGRRRSVPVVRFEGVTDEDGRFALPASGLRSAWALVIGEHPRMPVGAVLAHGEGPIRGARRLGEQLVAPPHGLRFRVVDDATGEPLSGASAVLKHAAFGPHAVARRFELPGFEGSLLPRFEADAEGVIEILRMPMNVAQVEIFAAGRCTEQRGVVLAPGRVRDEGEVRLEEAAWLAGSVLDSEGLAVAEAVVRVPASGASSWNGELAEAVTDAAGRFAFDAVGLRQFFAQIEHPEHVPRTQPVRVVAEDVMLRFGPSHWVRGTVEGLPAGVSPDVVTVEARTRRPEMPGGLPLAVSDTPRGRLLGRFPVDADGTFRVGPVHTFDLLIRGHAGKHGTSRWRWVRAPAAAAGVPALLEFGEAEGAALVAVVDQEGEPVSGVTVSWSNDPWALENMMRRGRLANQATVWADAPAEGLPQAVTDSLGTVTLGFVESTHLSVRVFDGNGLAFERGFAARNVPAQIDFVLPGAGSITGVVAGLESWSGERFRVEARQVEAHLAGGGADLPTQTEASAEALVACDVRADGYFDLGAVEPGHYLLDVVAVGEGERGEAAIQPAPGSMRIGERFGFDVVLEVAAGMRAAHVFELPDPGVLEGRVLRNGEPVSRVVVWAAPREPGALPPGLQAGPLRRPSGVPFEWTGSDGSYRFRVVGEQAVRLWARPRGDARDVRASGPTDVEVAHGATVVRDLVLAGGVVVGRLDVARDAGPRGLVAWLIPPELAEESPKGSPSLRARGVSWRSASLEEDGAFRFEGVSEGRYVLRFGTSTEVLPETVEVTVGGDALVDAGLVARTRLVPVAVGVDPESIPTEGHWTAMGIAPPPFGVRALRVGEGETVRSWAAERAFVDGVLALDLPPGEYELQLMEFARVLPGPSPNATRPTGRSATLRVGDEGSVEPEVLRFEER